MSHGRLFWNPSVPPASFEVFWREGSCWFQIPLQFLKDSGAVVWDPCLQGDVGPLRSVGDQEFGAYLDPKVLETMGFWGHL